MFWNQSISVKLFPQVNTKYPLSQGPPLSGTLIITTIAVDGHGLWDSFTLPPFSFRRLVGTSNNDTHQIRKES